MPLRRRLSLEILEVRETPATITWLGTAGTGWNNPANWNLGRVPQDGDDLVFGPGATNFTTVNNLSSPITVNSITISADGYTLDGSQRIHLTGALNVGVAINNAILGLPITLEPGSGLQQTFTVGQNSTLTVNSVLTSGTSAAQTLTKAGAGTMVLASNNAPFLGNITVAPAGGTLVVTNSGALGSGPGITTINNNAQIQLRGGITVNETIIINGSGLNNTGVLLNADGNNTWAGTISMDSNSVLGANAGTTLTVTGLINDLGAGYNLTKTGPGTVVFARQGGNSYRGQTIINNGVLTIQDPLSLGAGSDVTKPQSNTFGAATIVNYNDITGEAGTLALNFVSLAANDPNGVLQNPSLPFNPVTNPYVGFQVFRNQLFLNGPGFNNQGALVNLTGRNIWNGTVTIRTPYGGSTQPVLIGVAPPAANLPSEDIGNLTISGQIVTPAAINLVPSALVKVGPGRLIFDNVNPYSSTTVVAQGALNVRDSRSLGAITNPPVGVIDGAALELQVDTGFDGTALRSNGRNLASDSILGTNPGYLKLGLQLNNPLSIDGLGINATGALRSISGINNYVAPITIGETAAIGVDGDPNRQTDNSYFYNDWSLTTQDLRGGTLVKRGTGHLILPNANTYGGQTLIQEGWVTIRNNQSLGQQSGTQTTRPYTEVSAGAALHLLPAAGQSLNLPYNLILAGTGIDHPYSIIDGQGSTPQLTGGALMNLDGINTISGIIQFNGQAGIGVAQIGLTTTLVTPPLASTPTTPSQLTLTTELRNNGSNAGGLVKLGDRRLVVQAAGTYTGDNSINAGVLLLQNDTGLGTNPNGSVSTTTVLAGAALELANTTTANSGGLQRGLNVWNERLVLNGSGNTLFSAAGALTVLANPADPGTPLRTPILPTDNAWRGPITLGSNAQIDVRASSRLIVTGAIDDTTPASLTLTGGGQIQLAGNSTFRGTTTIAAGMVLTVANSQALGAPSTAEVQTLNFTNFTAGNTFTLTFNSRTTTPITYTGTPATDAAAIAAALNALSSIGSANIGGLVTVSAVSSTEFRVTFGGNLTGFDQPALIPGGFSAPQDITVTETTKGSGAVIVQNGGSLQLAGSVNISGKSLLVNGTGATTSPLQPIQWFNVGPAPSANGQVIGTGAQQNVSGRVTSVVVDPTDANVMYITTAGGNAWRTFDGGVTWRPLMEARPNIQDLDITGTGNFTLTLTVNDPVLGTLTGTTATITYSSDPLTLQANIQNALNTLLTQAPLSNVGGVASVVHTGGTTFRVTFGGNLISSNIDPLTISGGGTVTVVQAGGFMSTPPFVGAIAINPGSPNQLFVAGGEANNSADSFYGTGIYRSNDYGNTWTLVTNTDGSNPFYGKAISKIQVANNRLFVASGDAIAPRNAVQRIRHYLQPGQSFTLSFDFVRPDGSSVLVTTAAITFNPFGGPPDPTIAAVESALNTAIQNAGLTGSVVVRDGPGLSYDVEFVGAWAGLPMPLLRHNRTNTPDTGDPTNTMFITSVTNGGRGVVNGTVGGPGIWRYPLGGGDWFNMTATVSTIRASAPSSRDANIPAPNLPGPDDDYRLFFPQQNATWSDLVVVNPPVGGFILFAALGTATGDANNGVYWTRDVTSNNPRWYVGQPGDATNPPNTQADRNGAQNVTDSGPAFPTGRFINPVSSGANSPVARNVPPHTYPVPQLFPVNGTIKLAAVVTTVASNNNNPAFAFNPGYVTVVASVARPDGTLRGVWRSNDGGMNWAQMGTLPTNFLANQGFYNHSVIAIPNTNINSAGETTTNWLSAINNGVDPAAVFVAGTSSNVANQTGMIYRWGGGTWGDVSTFGGNGARSSIHAMTLANFGPTNPSLLVGSDGGLWRFNLLSNTWGNNLTGNLAIAQVNGVSQDPTNFNSILAGVQSNGTQQFNGQPLWNVVDKNYGGQMGGGQVVIDPQNPLNRYAVQSQLGGNAVVRRSRDGGLTWQTILDLNTSNQLFSPLSGYVTITLDRISPNRLLVGTMTRSGIGIVYESFNGGDSWINLTANFPYDPVNNPLDNVVAVGVAGFQGVFVADPAFPLIGDIKPSEYDRDTIYITDGTRVYLTKDHGQSWVDRSPAGGGGPIVDLKVDPRNRDTLYIVRGGFGGPKVLVSTNAGRTWTNITGNLPNVPTWKIVVDPRNDSLYVGNDLGVYVLPGGSGTTWQRFGAGLPNVQVRDLELNQVTNTLLAGTYGRSVYQLFLDSSRTILAPTNAALVALSGSSTWSGPVVLGQGSSTVTIGANGVQNLPNGISIAQLNITGLISDEAESATTVLRKLGVGDVILSAANRYEGVTQVNEGQLVVAHPNALGNSTTGNTVVAAGAALALQSNLDAEPVTLNGNGIIVDGHYTGALRNISGVNTYNGPLTLAGTTAVTIGVDSGSQLTLVAPGSIIGTVALVKELTGTLVLATDNSTFSGGVFVHQGALRLRDANALGTGSQSVVIHDGAQIQLQATTGGDPISVNKPLLLSGTGIFGKGALYNFEGNNTWAGPITVTALPGFTPFTNVVGVFALGAEAGSSLTVTGSIAQALASNVTLPGTTPVTITAPQNIPVGLRKVGAGTVVLAAANTYSGSTEVVEGVLRVQHANALGTRTAATVNAVQQITFISLSGTDGSGSVQLNFAGQTRTVAFNTNRATMQTNVQTAINQMLNDAGFTGATVTVTSADLPLRDLNGQPATARGYVFTVTFNNNTTADKLAAYTTLPITVVGINDAQVSANFVAPGGVDVLVNNGAELQLAGGITVLDHLLTLNGSGQSGNGALYNFSGNNVWDGPINLATPTSIGVNSGTDLTLDSASTLTNGGTASLLTQKINTTSDVTQTGTFTITYNNPLGGSSTTSNISYGASALVVQNAINALLPTGTFVTVGLETRSNLIGGVDYIYTVTWGGSVALHGSQLVVTKTGGNANTDFTADPLQVTNALTKAGAGTLLFPTVHNQNLALTNVNAGVVDVDGLITDVRLNGGTLTGTGTIGVINPFPAVGGIVDPGVLSSTDPISYGQLTSSGGTFNATDTFFVDIGAAGNNDSLVSNGAITLNNAILSGKVHVTSIAEGTSYVILTTDFGSNPSHRVYGVFAPTPGTPTVDHTTLPQYLGQDAYAANIVYISGFKFEVGYYPNAVILNRVFPTISMVVTPSSPTPIYGQAHTFTATLTPEAGSPAATGNVVFTVTDPASTSYGPYTIAIVGGQAVLNIPAQIAMAMREGTWQVTASYNGQNSNGDQVFQPVNNIPSSATVQPAPTTTTVVASPTGSSVYGQAVTFTATVTRNVAVLPVAGTSAPAGTVSFYVGSVAPANLLGTGTLSGSATDGTNNAVATASYTTGLTQLNVGANQTIIAVYNSDGVPDNYDSSQGNVTHTVIQATSQVNLTPPSSTYGDPITFTATVTPVAPASGTPTGTVTFYLGATGTNVLGTQTLSGGSASLTIPALDSRFLPGSYVIRAVYSGDSNFTAGTTSITHVVNPTPTTTTLQNLTGSPTNYGTPVTFRATVTSTSGTPVGSVTFRIQGGATLATVNLVAGVATYTTTAFQLPGGNHIIEAVYNPAPVSGVVRHAPSTGTVNHVVNAVGTSVTLASSKSPSVAGERVTFTARVIKSITGGANPTGTVTFYHTAVNPANILGTGTLQTVSGVTTASYQTAAGQLLISTLGNTPTIIAVYSGDTNYTGNQASRIQTINKANTTMALTSTGSPAAYGTPVTFTATVTPVAPGAGVPTGTVAFYRGSVAPANLLSTEPLMSGVASYTTSTLAMGSSTIIAVYAGDANFNNAPNASRVQVIRAGTQVTNFTSSLPTWFVGQTVTLTADVVLTGSPPTGRPTGTVTFRVGSTVLGTVTAAAVIGDPTRSRATLVTNLVPAGSPTTITVVYNGSTFHMASQADFQRTVNRYATNTVLAALPAAVVSGQAVTLTATVVQPPGQPIPTGTVTFFRGATPIATVTLPAGSRVVSFTTRPTDLLAVNGPATITAVYNGSGRYEGSTSAPQTVQVNPAATNIAIAASTLSANRALTITGTVTPVAPGRGVPTGTARLFVDDVFIGTVTLNAQGRAVFGLPAGLPLGTRAIRIEYDGDNNFNPFSRTVFFTFISGGGRVT